MNTLLFLAFLSIFFWGCNQATENTTVNSFRECTSTSWGSDDSMDTNIYKTGRGALLGTRIASFEEMNTIIQIEYEHGSITADSTAPENSWVKVHHCSYGREVISVLEKGITEGDFYKAMDAILPRFTILFRCPYAVMNRRDLDKTFVLARFRPELFGVGDLAFFDIAKALGRTISIRLIWLLKVPEIVPKKATLIPLTTSQRKPSLLLVFRRNWLISLPMYMNVTAILS